MKKYYVKYLNDNSPINIGDKIRSESYGKFAVTVTGIDEDGDYITDELDFHEYFDKSYFVVKKNKAQKLGNLMVFNDSEMIGEVSPDAGWILENEEINESEVRFLYKHRSFRDKDFYSSKPFIEWEKGEAEKYTCIVEFLCQNCKTFH